MATIVKTNEQFARCRVFTTQDGHDLFVSDFKDGIVKYEYVMDNIPEVIARIIVECFDDNSNFSDAIFEAYNCPSNSAFYGIELSFFGKKMLVTKQTASIIKILEFMEEAINEFIEFYKEMKVQEFKNLKRVAEELNDACYNQIISFENNKSERMWMSWKQNSENHHTAIVGEFFAKYVQFLMEKRALSDWRAFEKAYETIVNYGFFNQRDLEASFSMLIRCWKYGWHLEMWVNDKISSEVDEFLKQI